MGGASGLRERKKERMRHQIRETAQRLFVERGFDAVTVAEVARAVDVSEATVFNYFPTKEDLVYSGMEDYENELLATIRERPPGESVLAALQRFALVPHGLLAEADGSAGAAALARIATMARVVAASPSLLARERQIFAHSADTLATLIAEETGAGDDDVAPWVAANALIGVHHAVLDYGRRRALAGDPDSSLARDVRAVWQRGLGLLEGGFSHYAIKPQ